jgi:hypothetical protein
VFGLQLQMGMLSISGDFSLITFMACGKRGMRNDKKKWGTSSKIKKEKKKFTKKKSRLKNRETISKRTFEWTHCFFHPVKISQDLGLLFYHLVSSYAVWHEMFLLRSLLPSFSLSLSLSPSLSPHIKCNSKNK